MTKGFVKVKQNTYYYMICDVISRLPSCISTPWLKISTIYDFYTSIEMSLFLKDLLYVDLYVYL